MKNKKNNFAENKSRPFNNSIYFFLNKKKDSYLVLKKPAKRQFDIFLYVHCIRQ